MRIHGEHSLPVPAATVWAALNDPEVLARTLPGCERLTRTGENRLEGALHIKVGPVQGQFAGTVEMSDIRAGEGYRIHLSGKGAPGFVEGRGDIRVAAAEGGTRLSYDLDVQVGGRIAGVGQRLLDSSARVVTRQALEGLEQQLVAIATAGKTPADLAAPSAAEFAGRLARGVAADLLPPGARRAVWLGVAGLALILLAILWRGCGS